MSDMALCKFCSRWNCNCEFQSALAAAQTRIEELTKERDSVIEQRDHARSELSKATEQLFRCDDWALNIIEHYQMANEPGDDFYATVAKFLKVAVKERESAESRLSALTTENERLRSALTGLVKCNEDWNEAVLQVIQKPLGWTDGYLDEARAVLNTPPADGGAR